MLYNGGWLASNGSLVLYELSGDGWLPTHFTLLGSVPADFIQDSFSIFPNKAPLMWADRFLMWHSHLTSESKMPVIVCTLFVPAIDGYSINDRVVPFIALLCACRFWKSVTIG